MRCFRNENSRPTCKRTKNSYMWLINTKSARPFVACEEIGFFSPKTGEFRSRLWDESENSEARHPVFAFLAFLLFFAVNAANNIYVTLF